MKDKLKNKKTRRQLFSLPLFIAGVILAGTVHVLDRLSIKTLTAQGDASSSSYLAFFSTALFILNLSIYVFLILSWLISVKKRLLPTRGRAYIISAALFMLFFLFDRAVKYRISDSWSLLEHVSWYLFYIPVAMIPTAFLLTGLFMGPESKARKAAERTVWVISSTVVVFVLTNDLHFLMFRPTRGYLNGYWASYENGPIWYVFYGYVILAVLSGLVLLAKNDRRNHTGRKTFLPALLMLIMFAALNVFGEKFNARGFISPWEYPETIVICMLLIFESCIRSRLIPYNENYEGFFGNMKYPAVITDRDLKPVFLTSNAVSAGKEDMKSALDSPKETEKGVFLYGKKIGSGYVFWSRDERRIRSLNEELADIVDTLESENDLLRYENALKEERAKVDARNRVYSRAESEVYPTQKKIAALLEKTSPDGEDFDENLAKILMLNAYVKRKVNFVLSGSEKEYVAAEELFLALDESARYITLCGINASVIKNTDRQFPSDEAISLYDAFETIAEALPRGTEGFMITLNDRSLKLSAGCESVDIPPLSDANVSSVAEDGQLFITVTAKGEAI